MATLVVSLICIALVIVGGMMLSQGILSSADTAAAGISTISTREAEITRTAVTEVSVESVTFDDALRVRVRNTGLDKLADYAHWDVIVSYTDAAAASHVVWLPYTDGTPSANEWTVADIWQNGPNEYFDPGILNPQEDLMIYAPLDPAPAASSAAEVTVIADNGADTSMDFTVPSSGMFVPHSESFAITGTDYFYLLGGVPADDDNMTETTGSFSRRQTGRWLLYNQADPSQDARHCFTLNGLSTIPASTWTVTYRGRANGSWYGGSQAQLNMDVVIRRADGTIRQTIATRVAVASFTSFNSWQTLTATYSFPGYTVVDPSDMLEIDYYGQSTGFGSSSYNNSISLDVDDSALSANNLTRINY